MTLKENSDRELRKWCVDRIMMSGGNFSSATLHKAEDLFQYIKFGPDDGCDCCDEPNDGPNLHEGSMSMLRKLTDVDDGFHAS